MAVILSLMVLACLALIGGAVVLWRRGERRRQVVLMLVMAVVIAANIALLTVPGPDGEVPTGQLQ